MQERFRQAFLDILDYLDELDKDSAFWSDTVNCMVEDLLEYCHTVLLFSQKDIVIHCLEIIKNRLIEDVNCTIEHQTSEIRKIILAEESAIIVDFLILRQSHWAAMKPVIDAFSEANCVVRIIPTPMIQEIQDNWGKSLQTLIQNDGYNIVDFKDYHIETMLPDIVIDDMAVDCAKPPEFRFLRISKLIDYTVHIEHSLLTGYTEAMKSAYFRIGRSRCWQYVVSSNLFAAAFPLIFRIDGEFLTAGYPEIDTIVKNHNDIEKENRKKTVLWNVDALDPNRVLKSDYLRLNRELDYLDKMSICFPNLIHIVRTHPNLKNQARASALLDRISYLCTERSNIIIDSNALIYETYQNVDAMITWMSSTTAFTFAATKKPFAVLPTFIENGYDTLLDMHLLQALYVVYREQDMIEFLNAVVQGADTKKEQRLQVINDYVGALDGSVSANIVKKVLAKYANRRAD